MVNEKTLNRQADEIASSLGETEAVPIGQIREVIAELGIRQVRDAVNRAKKTYELARTSDPASARTLGGYFFYQVKRDMDNMPDVRQRIFPNYGASHSGMMRWPERAEVLNDLTDVAAGRVIYATVTLKGRFRKVVQKGHTVIGVLSQEKLYAPVPNGIPTPDSSVTKFVVYMDRRHWQPVARLLRNKHDVAIIEGRMLWDEPTGTVAVLAGKVTTKEREKKRRKDAIGQTEHVGKVVERSNETVQSMSEFAQNDDTHEGGSGRTTTQSDTTEIDIAP
jgi:hypothetical protein